MPTLPWVSVPRLYLMGQLRDLARPLTSLCFPFPQEHGPVWVSRVGHWLIFGAARKPKTLEAPSRAGGLTTQSAARELVQGRPSSQWTRRDHGRAAAGAGAHRTAPPCCWRTC